LEQEFGYGHLLRKGDVDLDPQEQGKPKPE
jgi:hypothetical protein